MSRGRLRNSSKEPSSARAANVPALAGPTPTSGRRRKLPCCGSSAFSVTTQLCAEGRGCVPLFNSSEGNIFLRPSSRLKSEEKSDHKFLYFLIPRAPPADSLLSGPSQLGTEAVEGPSQDSLSRAPQILSSSSSLAFMVTRNAVLITSGNPAFQGTGVDSRGKPKEGPRVRRPRRRGHQALI